jgi:hypothetical protein
MQAEEGKVSVSCGLMPNCREDVKCVSISRLELEAIWLTVYNSPPMDILTALKQERDRIDAAIQALSGGGRARGGRGRAAGPRKGRRRLSAAARRKISNAAKARWAQAKRAGRNRL